MAHAGRRPTRPTAVMKENGSLTQGPEEVRAKLKMRKAGGKSGVLPELILHGGVDLLDRMLEVMQKVWEEGKVVRNWQDAVAVPIPKKGDLKQCDHWHGISLLDVVGRY